MPNASARRSFHGPLLQNFQTGRPRPPRRPSLELVPSSPNESALCRAVLRAARVEEPGPKARDRVLAGVLSALRGLTGGA